MVVSHLRQDVPKKDHLEMSLPTIDGDLAKNQANGSLSGGAHLCRFPMSFQAQTG